MFEKIKAILTGSFSLNPDDIQRDSKLEADLGINSLELAELALRCDEEFGVEIEDEDIYKLITVGDVADYVESKQG